MKPLTKKQKEEQEALSELNNSLRVFFIRGQRYELVGTERRQNGYIHTIKLPYSKIESRSRYEEVSDKKLMEIKKL